MPLIKPSPTVYSRLEAVEVVTTTIFSISPTSDLNNHTRPSVPVPAIAGGVIAGAFLAVVVTFVWICWGRAIKKTRQKQQQEMVCIIPYLRLVADRTAVRKNTAGRDTTPYEMRASVVQRIIPIDLC